MQTNQRHGSGLHLTKERATAQNLQNAKRLRKRMTPAEKVFWEHVRRRRFPGYRFRRNHPLEGFCVDFYCDRLRLVIEIDGEIHNYTVEYDQARTKVLESLGIRVIRFTNQEVFSQLDAVMARIFAFNELTTKDALGLLP
jgi:very-short-patch-repair endonuclease